MIFLVDCFGNVDVFDDLNEFINYVEWQDIYEGNSQVFDENGNCYIWDSSKKNEERTVFGYTMIKNGKTADILDLIVQEYDRQGRRVTFKVKLYTELINTIDLLIQSSNNLLNQTEFNIEEFKSHKKDCINLYYLLIEKNISRWISELAERGLKLEIKKIEGKYNQMIYNFLNWRNSISFQATFLLKHTEMDYYKKYIFWTKKKLEGINHNLRKRYN